MGEKSGLSKRSLEFVSSDLIVDRCRKDFSRLVLARNEVQKVLLLPGSGKIKKRLEVYLKGDNSRIEVLGIVLGRDEDNIDLTVNVIHQGMGTSAYTHVRSAVFNQSQSFFSGRIKIEKGANKTYSLLENRVLLLGAEAKAESVPSLEIEADDVKASHAATVGKINEMGIFYLQSRGISRKTAIRMIADGFFEPVLSKVDDARLVATIKGDLWVTILKI